MILFLDNLRGFNKTFIDINQVNFLIGENSTGKTTVMSILNLLSDENFLRNGEFRNRFVDFGPFKEIINQNGKNSESFAIGIIDPEKRFNNSGYDSVLLAYSEKEGFPQSFLGYFQAKGILVKIKLLDGGVYSNEITTMEGIDSLKEIFSNWENENVRIAPWKYLKFESIALTDMLANPLFWPFYSNADLGLGQLLRKYSLTNSGHSRILVRVLNDSIWIDPIRSKPQRIYEPNNKDYSPEGAHIPTVLRDIFLNTNSTETKKIIKIIHDFGRASGLFDEIIVDSYRKTVESPFEIRFKLNGKELKISNIGYGISQMLPIITEIAMHGSDELFLIQQPEVHLHPKSQAFFGQFFFEQYDKEQKSFIIETHSDFILDRFRLMIRKSRKKYIHQKVSFLFFESTNEGNRVTQIKIDKNGDYPVEQPDKFRDFFLNEELSLLGI